MKLYSLLSEEQIQVGLDCSTLEEALGLMLAPQQGRLDPVEPERVKELLMERERKMPTIIADGVCVPHARVEGLQDFHLLLGVSPKGIPAHGEPSGPIHLIFVILTPQTKNTLMLQTLAAVARLLHSAKTRQALASVKTPSRLMKIIEDSGVDVKKTLCANDIMTPVEIVAHLDTPLTAAMELLMECPDEGVPVQGPGGELLGEVVTRDIIALGLPKYMGLMENPTLLDSIEPFEQFFKKERFLKTADLLQKDPMTVEPDTPVVQIAHQMLASHRRRAYVLRDGKLAGVIYRKDIVTKVLML